MEPLPRGTVLRVPSHDRLYGEYIDLMFFLPDDGGGAMVITTGPKAGHVVVRVPDQAFAPATRMIAMEWLKENWREWIWPDCDFEEVVIVGRYPPPSPKEQK